MTDDVTSDFTIRVKNVRKKLKLTQAEFAEEMEVDQGTVSRWEGGVEPTHENYEKLDRLIERFENEQNIELGRANAKTQNVRVKGVVGAGAAVYSLESDTASEEVEYVTAPIHFGKVEAVLVRGDSMYPAYRDGDRIFFGVVSRNEPEKILGKECLVRLADGRVMIKMVHEGSKPQHYDLHSYNAPVLRDQLLEEALPVRYIERK